MPEQSVDFRDEILQRLGEDLIGPSGPPDEIIEERPSDRYLTGILYPQRTEAGGEADESLGSGAGSEGDESAFEQVAMVRMLRPASAGLSFAVSGDAPQLSFSIRCGIYLELETSDTPEGTPEQSRAANPKPGAAKVRVSRWQRRQCECAISIDPRSAETVPLALHGIPGLELTIKCSPLGAGWLVTAVLVNRNTVKDGESRLASDAKAFFQTEMKIAPGIGTRLPARPSRRAALDDDGRSAALLYRDALEFAVGHTASAEWLAAKDGRSAEQIGMTWIPTARVDATSSRGGPFFIELAGSEAGKCFDAEYLAADSTSLTDVLSPFLKAYEAWISARRSEVAALPEELRPQALRHLDDGAESCLRRMRGSLDLIASDETVATSFRLANRAMALQFRWTRPDGQRLAWRPFQLGFLLLAIESVANPGHAERKTMDLLWFPTGGGKTEAYLGLVAFTLFLRRLRDPEKPDKGAGTATLMRYTLRLLTTQQFERAAALILACEHLHRTIPELKQRLGVTPFSIGLWVGSEAVANKVSEALKSLAEGKPNRPDQLRNCPACRKLLAWGAGPQAAYVQVRCINKDCVLFGELPVWTVDEDLYSRTPSLVIGTIDKFAQLPRKFEAGRFFGLHVPHDPPDLIIQDELHLISGPLGTIAGLYEAAIDELCARKGVRPKIIGSTATIRRAQEQIHALFDRSAQLFPPPGLDAADSAFAVRDSAAPARRYAAVTTAGRSQKFTLQAVAASLLQSVGVLIKRDASLDAYFTLIAYFNSLRELGGALILMRDDVPDAIEAYSPRRAESPREIPLVAELTSRLSQTELKDRLKELEEKVESGAAIDVLLATNMISVGIDISRLGLMIMNGQPKAVAEYIQATSRVGRGDVPGLVVSVYNNGKARDRSRFEAFRTWHETLYREVEATSVTPFSSRARDRALRAVLVSLSRHLVPSLSNDPALGDAEAAVTELITRIVERAKSVEPEEADATQEQLDSVVEDWASRSGITKYHDDWKPASALMISAERAATMVAAKRDIGRSWPVPSSMRNVEPTTKVALTEVLKVEQDEDGAE